MRNSVVITGLGTIGSAGLTVSESWETLKQGKCTAQYDKRLEGLGVSLCCPVSDFQPEKFISKSILWRTDKFIHLALIAAHQAITDSGLRLATTDKSRIGIVLGNSLAGISSIEKAYNDVASDGFGSVRAAIIPASMANMAAGHIAIQYGITGPTLTIGSACASGADAIGLAKKMIENNECDIVIAGASEAPITSLIISSFARLGALSTNNNPLHASRPFDQERDGFVISEGAGLLVLENKVHAEARKAEIYAVVSGYGTSNDAYHVTSPDPQGAGLKQAITKALRDAALRPEEIDCINAHGTSTPLNDRIESNVIDDIFGRNTKVTSTKGATGHCLAAAGAIEAIFSVLTLKNNFIPGVVGLEHIDSEIKISIVESSGVNIKINSVLSNSIGFGGQNSSLVFQKYNKELI
ncbi:MAG: beta-ketoacyl-[acyl-carrier-protein] synthase family protein [Serratia sp. (in: enterobacteria)]|uniref:beta-ketoacyl-[acyl-carrier-protein] synthase family protein n=1 Tax=Serratia sp. (in: enterobacteria) TaxID=616 RepID=UPI003F2EB960